MTRIFKNFSGPEIASGFLFSTRDESFFDSFYFVSFLIREIRVIRG
jgi:hypothetical protein